MNIRPIIQFILKDPIRKIFAIIFTFGLWFYVAIDENYQYKKTIRIVYSNLPESLILVDSLPSIDVIFDGRGGSLLSIWAVAPRAYCDLHNAGPGVNKIPVKNIFIPIGFGDVSITYLDKISINININKKITKPVAVTVPIKGTLKEGFALSRILVLDSVTVTGPAEYLADFQDVKTESLVLKSRATTMRRPLTIQQPSPLVKVSQPRVMVETEVDYTAERLITNIPLKLVYGPGQRVYSEKTVLDTLVVRGPKGKIEALEKRDIEVSIKLTNVPRGDYNLPASIILPEYIKPIYSKPQRFMVKVQ